MIRRSGRELRLNLFIVPLSFCWHCGQCQALSALNWDTRRMEARTSRRRGGGGEGEGRGGEGRGRGGEDAEEGGEVVRKLLWEIGRVGR